MSCYAQGRCEFCRRRHTMPIIGGDEITHSILQKSNLNLVALNTVCSLCFIKIEDFLKKENLSFDEIIAKKTHGTITENSTESANHISSDNPKILGKQNYDNFSMQSTIDSREVDVNSTIDKTHVKQVAKIGVEDKQSLNSTDTQRKTCVGINNLQITNKRNQNCKKTQKKRQLTCHFCQKNFDHAGDFNKHRRTHTGEQPYTCNTCQKKFTLSSNLARHRRMHSGKRPYSCQICGHTFTRKDKLAAHVTAQRCITKL